MPDGGKEYVIPLDGIKVGLLSRILKESWFDEHSDESRYLCSPSGNSRGNNQAG